MAWTPPTKFIVILTFLTMVFGIIILLDYTTLFWTPSLLPAFSLGPYNGWLIITVILVFLTWFLFFLGVKMKGL
ncbi:MAG: hypothetical protein KAX18_13380 [Candidatus Lokiarchaeota archaeon]|nr:hypothetical protein [Candidatus Lokiarchaeota archaeon]